jgi:hypothetical protein
MVDDSGSATGGVLTVSPGDIDAFSKVMSAVTSDIESLTTELTSLISAPDLGEYDKSSAGLARYQKAATAHRDFTHVLALRSDKLVTSTADLARQYSDLEQLNASGSSVISSYLGTSQAV